MAFLHTVIQGTGVHPPCGSAVCCPAGWKERMGRGHSGFIKALAPKRNISWPKGGWQMQSTHVSSEKKSRFCWITSSFYYWVTVNLAKVWQPVADREQWCEDTTVIFSVSEFEKRIWTQNFMDSSIIKLNIRATILQKVYLPLNPCEKKIAFQIH